MPRLLGFALAALLCASSLFAETTGVEHFTKMRMEYANEKDFNPAWEEHEDREKITQLWTAEELKGWRSGRSGWRAFGLHDARPVCSSPAEAAGCAGL